ncbi:hypothetical protein ES707_22394 [subsurface metagenome]
MVNAIRCVVKFHGFVIEVLTMVGLTNNGKNEGRRRCKPGDVCAVSRVYEDGDMDIPQAVIDELQLEPGDCVEVIRMKGV